MAEQKTQPPPPEHILKLAEKIRNEAGQNASPVPKMKIPKLYDLEFGLGIGDIMVMLTLLPGLQELYPDWTLRVICEKKDWVSLGHDYVVSPNEMEALGTRGEKYFKQFDKEWRDYDLEALATKELRHELFGKRLGVTPQRFKVRLTADVDYWAAQILNNVDKLKVVGIAPYSSSAQRTWPDENWVCLIELLIRAGYMPVMLGGPGEGERSKFYPCMRFWGLGAQRTAALIKQCDLVIGNDSGVAHVAAILRRPTLVLGAPTDTPRIFGWYDNVTCLQARGGCSLCYWERSRGHRQECNYRCRMLAAIPVDDVYLEARRILDGINGKADTP